MKKDGTITIKGKDITIDGSGKINAKAEQRHRDEGLEDSCRTEFHESQGF
jgi:hypothetical protein